MRQAAPLQWGPLTWCAASTDAPPRCSGSVRPHWLSPGNGVSLHSKALPIVSLFYTHDSDFRERALSLPLLARFNLQHAGQDSSFI